MPFGAPSPRERAGLHSAKLRLDPVIEGGLRSLQFVFAEILRERKRDHAPIAILFVPSLQSLKVERGFLPSARNAAILTGITFETAVSWRRDKSNAFAPTFDAVRNSPWGVHHVRLHWFFSAILIACRCRPRKMQGSMI